MTEKLQFKESIAKYFIVSIVVFSIICLLISLFISIWFHPIYGVLLVTFATFLLWKKKKNQVFFLEFYETHLIKNYLFNKSKTEHHYREINKVIEVQGKNMSYFLIELKNNDKKITINNKHQLYLLLSNLSKQYGFPYIRKFTSVPGH